MNTRENKRAVFSIRAVPRGYKKDTKGRLSQLSSETPECRDLSLGIELRNSGIRITECNSVENWKSAFEEET
jgi:hypothetical protein